MNHEDIQALAGYNSEVARGIVHTQAWKDQMNQLQQEFNEEEKYGTNAACDR